MSFFRPDGLIRRPGYARYKDIRPAEDWTEGEIANCSFEDVEFHVFTPTETEIELTADPGTLETFGAFTDLGYAELYGVTVSISAPDQLKSWHDPPACLPPPATYGVASPSAETEIYANLVNDAGDSIPSLLTAASDPEASGLVGNRGYVVNPVPPWPSPDIDGNTFGQVLWAAADVPTIVGRVKVQRGPGGTSGDKMPGIVVYLWPYNIGVSPFGQRRGCVVGAA